MPPDVNAGSSNAIGERAHPSNPRRSSTIMQFQQTIPDNTTGTIVVFHDQQIISISYFYMCSVRWITCFLICNLLKILL